MAGVPMTHLPASLSCTHMYTPSGLSVPPTMVMNAASHTAGSLRRAGSVLQNSGTARALRSVYAVRSAHQSGELGGEAGGGDCGGGVGGGIGGMGGDEGGDEGGGGVCQLLKNISRSPAFAPPRSPWVRPVTNTAPVCGSTATPHAVSSVDVPTCRVQ